MMSNKEKDWYKFEILTGFLLKNAYDISDTEFTFTRMVKDDGKDAIINKLIPSSFLENIDIKIWIEAKYRKKDNVKLADVGGHIIIASNSNIQTLFFVTNQFFTPQTIEQLLVFQLKTGLQIQLIDGYMYRNMLQERPEVKMVDNDLEGKIKRAKIIDFKNRLLENLPKAPSKVSYKITLTLERGRVSTSKELASVSRAEESIERRSLQLSEIAESKFSLDLGKAKVIPLIDETELEQNINYKLIGKERQQLFTETIKYLKVNETVIIKGDSGQGKSFFSNHIAREFYKSDYYVAFLDAENKNISSLTRTIIIDLIGIDYFKYLEHKTAVIQYLSEYLSIDKFIAEKLIELVVNDNFSEKISNDIYIQLLLKLFESYRKRKNILIVIDNLHRSTSDLLGFLKNLFSFLNELSIPVLVLTQYQNDKNDGQIVPEWLDFLDTIIESNQFVSFNLLNLKPKDIRDYIKALTPGANRNLVDFIVKNTLATPFYIKLFIEHLKDERVINSKDQKFWYMDEDLLSVYVDNSIVSSKRIEALIQSKLKKHFCNERIKKVAMLIFLFNNELNEETYKTLLNEIEITELIGSTLFHASIKNNSFMLGFSHDLYYNNFEQVLSNPKEELNYQSLLLIQKIDNNQLNYLTISDNVLGRLYEFSGSLQKSYDHYIVFARDQKTIDAFKSLVYFEKAFEALIALKENDRLVSEYENVVVDTIFSILELYNRYNFLSARKSSNLFLLLEKFDDFKQLNIIQQLMYYLFLGTKETKSESFWQARIEYKKAVSLINNNVDLPQNLIDMAIVSYGINLKHIGEKDESLIYFEQELNNWKTKTIEKEKFSNEAAYYLTANPKKSLQCYEYIRDKLQETSNLHLIIDFAMVNFYLQNFELSINYLEKAVAKAKRKISLAQEARAENILGILHWNNQNYMLAEKYLDIAVSNCELANNHRWLWRIRTNLAQVALLNGNETKAFNIGWSVIEHMIKTKDAIKLEVQKKSLNSRRYASLKAIIYLLFKLDKKDIIAELDKTINIDEVSIFCKELKTNKNIQFDLNDNNRFGESYYILG
jgi:hypothetical protein